MSTIKEDQRRLDNIANAYHKTGGEVRKMWKNKWYELVRKLIKSSHLNLKLVFQLTLVIFLMASRQRIGMRTIIFGKKRISGELYNDNWLYNWRL